MAFVHLHVHSQYSILDGTADPGKLAKAASKLGHTALALTDTANLFGAVTFAKKCKDVGIKPVIGAELHVQPEGIAFVDPAREHGGYQLIALVEDDTGYRNLCQLVTAGIFDGMQYKPRIDLDLLRRHKDGLIFLTSGAKGVIGRTFARSGDVAARESLRRLQEILPPEQLFLELLDVGLPEDDVRNTLVRAFAADTGYRTVVTNAVHYLAPRDASIHEVLHDSGQTRHAIGIGQ